MRYTEGAMMSSSPSQPPFKTIRTGEREIALDLQTPALGALKRMSEYLMQTKKVKRTYKKEASLSCSAAFWTHTVARLNVPLKD